MKFFAVLALLATFSAAHASLGSDLAPLLALLAPTLRGLDIGLQLGAGNIKAAVQNAGAAVDQAANGVADVAANTAVGAGETLGAAPGAAFQTVRTLDHSPGVIGSLATTIFGH